MKFIQLVYTCNGVHLKNKQFYREKIPFVNVWVCLKSEMYTYFFRLLGNLRELLLICVLKNHPILTN